MAQARSVDRRSVEIGIIRIDDALLVTGQLRLGLGEQAVDQRLHIAGRFLAQQIERAEAAVFGRERVGIEPFLVDVGEEVVARIDLVRQERGVHAPFAEAHRGRFGRAFAGAAILQQHLDPALVVALVRGGGCGHR